MFSEYSQGTFSANLPRQQRIFLEYSENVHKIFWEQSQNILLCVWDFFSEKRFHDEIKATSIVHPQFIFP
jgi:hypothetical protein